MGDSILDTMKKMIGNLHEDFDLDVITNINGIFAILRQLGIGPSSGFRITGSTETWADFLTENEPFDEVKTYMYLKLRKVFDPPQSGALMESLDNSIREYEWRLQVDPEILEC